MKFPKVSRVLDMDMKIAVNNLSEEKRDEIINKLGVTRQVFQNWLDGKTKLVNAKTRNHLMHLLEM